MPSQLGELDLEPDQVVGGKATEDRVARLALDPELAQQLAVKVGVAEADHGAVEAGGVERRLQDLDHLGGPIRRRGADQLDPGLGELAHLAALRAHGAKGVGQVAKPQRRLGVGVAARDETRDRHRHVGAQGEQVAALVEEAVGGGGGAAVAAGEHLVVLDRGRRDLAVAAALEDLDHRQVQAAQLPHLIGQHVAGSWWNRVNHPPDLTRVSGESPARQGPLTRPVQSGRRGRAGARRSARSRGRSGGCCRSPRRHRPPGRR